MLAVSIDVLFHGIPIPTPVEITASLGNDVYYQQTMVSYVLQTA